MASSPDRESEPHSSTVPSQAGAGEDRALITFLTTRLNSEAEARDVAQEAYVRLLQLERPDTIGFHRAYLFRIAANLAMDRLRHRTVRAKAPTRELFAEWLQRRSPEQEALDAGEQEALQQALSELPEKLREALVRHFLTGESVGAIAAEWGLTDRMVRYYLARALAHCRAHLDNEGASS